MRASLSSSLNMNASPVWSPVYREPLTDGNRLERTAGARRRLRLVWRPRARPILRVECRWPKVCATSAKPWPSAADLCATPVVATIVKSGGAHGTRVFKPNPAAPIDCFYVYPTVSEERAGNSRMTSGPGEKRAVAQQFAALASVCRPFAPIYRQVTIAGVEAVLRHEPLP